MPVFRDGITLFALYLCAGCSSQARIEKTILSAFSEGVVIELQKSCAPIMGPAVALFSIAGPVQENSFENPSISGSWVHAESLAEFTDLMDSGRLGPGVGATILDGKKCFREMTDNANDILFGQTRAQYFSSSNRKIVIILPEATPYEGILFVQAP